MVIISRSRCFSLEKHVWVIPYLGVLVFFLPLWWCVKFYTLNILLSIIHFVCGVSIFSLLNHNCVENEKYWFSAWSSVVYISSVHFGLSHICLQIVGLALFKFIIFIVDEAGLFLQHQFQPKLIKYIISYH